MMRKRIAAVLLICMLTSLSACSRNLTEKSDIISLFQKHEEAFLQAANSGDYSSVERIRGVRSVYISETYVMIECGGAGLGPSTHYYGIFYTGDDNLFAVDAAEPEGKWVEHGEGYLYQEDGGDNRYYVEPLGNHFYYYEAHF